MRCDAQRPLLDESPTTGLCVSVYRDSGTLPLPDPRKHPFPFQVVVTCGVPHYAGVVLTCERAVAGPMVSGIGSVVASKRNGM